MIGTALHTQGGISALVNTWKASGLFEREHVLYLPTHCDGSRVQKFRLALGAIFEFIRLLHSTTPRLVHLHLASRASFWRKSIFMQLARVWGVPYVIHLHGGEFHLFYERVRARRAKRFIIRRFDQAAAVIVLSARWEQWVRDISGQVNVYVLHNSVKMPDLANCPLLECGPVLFLGRLGVGKGTYDLLECIATLRVKFPRVAVRLGGDGDLAGVSTRAAALGVADQVQILGWISGEDKARELARAGIYVLPSYNEGLPMSLLEAMAAGLPVVTTPVGGIPELVTDGVEGFLVQPGDVATLSQRLALLLADHELRLTMGAAARKKVASLFSVEVVLPELSAIYARVGGG